jgi:hypothetical protein
MMFLQPATDSALHMNFFVSSLLVNAKTSRLCEWRTLPKKLGF